MEGSPLAIYNRNCDIVVGCLSAGLFHSLYATMQKNEGTKRARPSLVPSTAQRNRDALKGGSWVALTRARGHR